MVEHRLPKARAAGSNPVSRFSVSLKIREFFFTHFVFIRNLEGVEMDTFILVFDIIGIIAFSVSGAMVGIRKQMDLFGVCVLGVVTATGGGLIRDIVLGMHPPRMFLNSADVIFAALTALITFCIVYFANKRKQEYIRFRIIYSIVLFAMDTLGLAIFTVIGIEVALNQDPSSSSFLLIFVGAITGVGGGLLRDMMSGSIPYIFQKHIYATACIVGSLVCVLLFRKLSLSLNASMLIGALTVFTIRILAAYLHWDLPVVHLEEGNRKSMINHG